MAKGETTVNKKINLGNPIYRELLILLTENLHVDYDVLHNFFIIKSLVK